MVPFQKEPIAIVGSGCRFPGESSSPSKLWDLLRKPKDVLSKIPVARFNTNGVYHPDGMHHGSTNVRESYLLSEDHRVFDAGFFSVKPIEAQSIDPQQRLMLETVYEALESAGLTIESLKGSNTAVYVGLMANEYGDLLSRDIDHLPTYFATATAASIMSNRISYFFDWHGPCMTIDTACSSSLVAVHQAVQTLRNSESRVAVAAGANLILGPKPYISENKLNMLSPGSRSRMWDEKADGYARGEGVAALILKTLSQAIKDGDDIECIIRETGVNQDGRTKGITMPSSVAQEMLIKETYSKAGLDISNPRDRPQFFEAHGTGTPAGDPQEASAIYNAFFGSTDADAAEAADGMLHVGSIKTVIGHTEGTAGIAALLKASLAMKHGTIPPNLLFEKLNPEVEPYYGPLKVPTLPLPWPSLPAQEPRRASVNSFGFGGTNAHAILETPPPRSQGDDHGSVFLPFTFSAASEHALLGLVNKYATHLKVNETILARDLAYTLNFRRSKFSFRRSFSTTSINGLISKMQAFLDQKDGIVSTPTPLEPPKILGVFTGQGAQWPAMIRELVLHSVFVRELVQRLESVLAGLPESDRPTWSLMEELLADASVSRVQQAALSQPLCTVVQIVLVDILRAAGIQFSAVVGHSSGEIGAAYAAGFLSAEDALRIAYYRGVHSGAARSTSGAPGSMMAVGTSFEDAKELCDLEAMAGRISVAACNSSSSVTLSGDVDAIDEALLAFQDEKKFVRKLKVDTAYHSHHMHPCAAPYISSLEKCNIKILRSAGSACPWFSSVTGKLMAPDDATLESTYWSDNMTLPVMFSQAIQAALEVAQPDVAFEVGPHPALRGPALQTVQEITGHAIPYSGILERGKNDVESVMDALAFASYHVPPSALDLQEYDRIISGAATAKIVKDLPSYAWDHDRIYWKESRLSRAMRTLDTPVHELLGRLCSDNGLHQLRWRNVISPKEIPWLDGHQLQGQVVFPAAGYASMAIEAARSYAGPRSIRMLELRGLVISKAMVFDTEESSAEIFFTLNVDGHSSSDPLCHANFFLEGTTSQDSDELVTFCSGVLLVEFGDPQPALLPNRAAPLIDTVDVDQEHFYKYLATLGYHYSGQFRALYNMKRTTDSGTALIKQPLVDTRHDALLVHPAMLDCAIQAVILAFCWPEDNRLWSLHVPTKIARLRLNPANMASNAEKGEFLPVDSLVGDTDAFVVSGDISIYDPRTCEAIIQLEGVEIVPFTGSSPDMDAKLFFNMRWGVAGPDGSTISKGQRATHRDYELGTSIDRVSYLYLKQICEDITEDEWNNAEWHFRQIRVFAKDIITRIESGAQPGCDPGWKNDTHDQIAIELAKWPGNIDLRLMKAVGDNLAAAIRGETMILEHMLYDNVLNNFYCQGLGLDVYTQFLSNAVQQIVYRYANMNILEIGAGTGGVTKTIIKEMGDAFASYTYTDISSGFFDTAQEVFKNYKDRMIFRTLDVEKDPLVQNFPAASYDLIICSLVLHATGSIENTLRNVRQLLKPGGYLVMLEITNMDSFRTGFGMSALPGWWLGHKDGRPLNPCISADRWNDELKKTGFGGIKAITSDLDPTAWPFSVIVSQATNDRFNLLQHPLSNPTAPLQKDLLLVGGATEASLGLATTLQHILHSWYQNVEHINVIDKFNETMHERAWSVVAFSDLDSPVFKDLTSDRFCGLRQMFENSKNVFWVTKGARGQDPYASMITGFSRTLTMEMPHLRLQLLDIDSTEHLQPAAVAEHILRLELTENWDEHELGSKMLWSIEPEMALEQGVLKIPRVFALDELNNRYNSTRRRISKKVDLVKQPVKMVKKMNGEICLQEQYDHPQAAGPDENVTISVVFSSTSAVRIALGCCLFLVAGVDTANGGQMIAFAPDLASRVTVPKQYAIPISQSGLELASRLETLVLEIFVQYTRQQVSAGSKILLIEPPQALAHYISNFSSIQGVTLTCITSDPGKVAPNTAYVHGHASARMVKDSVPLDVAAFVDFNSGSGCLVSQIRSHLPVSCLSLKAADLFTSFSFNRTLSVSEVGKALRLANEAVGLTSLVQPSIWPLQDLSQLSDPSDTSLGRVVEWNTSPTILVDIHPVDSKPLFRPNRTYVLFGLTGQIGRSLALWMVKLGAKHIVLTSRRPAVDDDWLKKVLACGAKVRIVANDITDKQAVTALVQDIRETMPQIGGVANAAMVLQDTAIPEMTLETMSKVLRPKVDGTTFLDEIFQEDSLEFFIAFSSIASIFGQHGQSNYTAANMFLNGLINRRRQKGLAGSVMAIGAVLGIGYISREVDKTTYQRIQQNGYRFMSERDLHLLFAEAVVASSHGIEGNPDAYEIITGIREMNYGEERTTTNPIFQHVIIRPRSGLGSAEQEVAKVPLKTQLLAATSDEEVHDYIQNAFLEKLQSILQLEQPPQLENGSDELGVDSLIAVEVRSWFLKELNVDMPVLKILGGATVGAMLQFAREKLPHEMTPKVQIQPSSPPSIRIDNSAPATDSSGASTSSHDSGDDSGNAILTPNTELAIDPSKLATTRVEPMSHGQTRFWFLRSLLRDRSAFNISFAIELRGELHPQKLATAVTSTLRRHAALRTRFYDSEDGSPMQEVLETPTFNFSVHEVSSKAGVVGWYNQLKAYDYHLESGELMQMVLLRQNPTAHYLLVGYHHINMDSASLQVLLGDIDKAYRGVPLSPKVLQYPEYAARQRQALKLGEFDSDLSYWRSEFSDFPPTLPLLPFAEVQHRTTQTSYGHSKVSAKLPSTIGSRIQAVCSKHRISPYHFHLANFRALLFRYLAVADIAIGMADANRTEMDQLEAIGLYLNLLPLRFQNSSEQSFLDVAKQAQSKVRQALAHSRLPFDVLIEQLEPERSMEYTPIFQAFIDYKPPIPEKTNIFGCNVGTQEYDVGHTAYDITLSIVDEPNGAAEVIFQLQESLYSETEAKILIDSYVWLLEQFGSRPETTLGSVSLVSPAAVEEAKRLGTGPLQRSDWPETISHRVQQMVDAHGNLPAVIDDQKTLSYRALNSRVSILTARMLEMNVKPGFVVATFQEPGSDWLASLLAILRIGAIYLPLDVRTPIPRLMAMVKESLPVAILAHGPTMRLGESFSLPVTRLVDVSKLAMKRSDRMISICSTAKSPAFLFYTSGTTGDPKGVLVPHEGLPNQIECLTQACGIGVASRILQQTAFCFDMSLVQAFLAIANGGCLIIASSSQRAEPAALMELVVAEKVTLTFATPSEYLWWIQSTSTETLRDSHLQIAITGGEKVKQSVLDAFKSLQKPKIRHIDAYGPTEATIFCNFGEVDYTKQHRQVPVGSTIPNTAVYIVDEDMQIVPAGMPGEVMIAGIGTNGRYLNKDYTKSRYLCNPFASSEYKERGWTNMYRTGDKGRLLQDGSLIIEGRISGDTQVKVRGVRMELQDIEKNLVQLSEGSLLEAAVTVRGDPAFLVAHVVFAKDRLPEDSKGYLQRLLSRFTLPQYMCPAVIIPLERFPVNQNFKLDRAVLNQLPLPEVPGSIQEVGPLTVTERRLNDIWSEVLPIEARKIHAINASADFFHVGGNSMLLAKVQRGISNVFNVTISLVRFFENSTLQAMAALVDGQEAESGRPPIDWEAETAVRLEDFIEALETRDRPFSVPRSVILTGSTGFLGRVLVEQLLKDPTIERVHCIGVRQKDSTALPVLFSSVKVRVHYGDLTQPHLGLAEAELDEVLSDADCIIHNAADVSFMKSYHSVRLINVEATKELVRLAHAQWLPFHYISTSGVAHLSGLEEFPEVSASAYRPPLDGTDGYVASKWASEVYLEKVSRLSGLPIWIHRPSSIMGDDSAPTDLMASLFKYSLKLQAVPVLRNGNGTQWNGGGYADLIDVSKVATGILEHVLGSVLAGPNGPKFVHHSGEMVIPMQALVGGNDGDEGEQDGGLGLKSIPLADWVRLARNAGMNELVAELLNSAEGSLETRTEGIEGFLLYPKLLKNAPTVT